MLGAQALRQACHTGGRRVIVNMAYASRTDLTKQISHETMDNLWPTDE